MDAHLHVVTHFRTDKLGFRGIQEHQHLVLIHAYILARKPMLIVSTSAMEIHISLSFLLCSSLRHGCVGRVLSTDTTCLKPALSILDPSPWACRKSSPACRPVAHIASIHSTLLCCLRSVVFAMSGQAQSYSKLNSWSSSQPFVSRSRKHC